MGFDRDESSVDIHVIEGRKSTLMVRQIFLQHGEFCAIFILNQQLVVSAFSRQLLCEGDMGLCYRNFMILCLRYTEISV